jgi:hypothetical protein
VYAGGERKLGREVGVWLEYLYQTGGDRTGLGIQAAVEQGIGVGVTPTWEKLFSGGRFLVENVSVCSLNSGRGSQRPLDLGGVGCERLLPLLGSKALTPLTSHLSVI